ncbi:hypothetical protein [Mycobacteroides salmoniphilum]|uniref:Uncharacterized protein n=1 Tax=Mycobacteroides salmoniphilum TaxID=404941 RepID=A0A4R8SL38_9MYCO|nr:hypothetical protein [Mycobacteroides salmoniphilum]TDZ98339.1 hypothetical protein CCUG60885_00207 [Mycobacteroides salmoniphilum]TEA02869.1 hypothetical protein CCUG60883_03491 [Mycobacteroides salmoniphilum]
MLNTWVFEESEQSTPEEPDVAQRFIDAIVLTQSCDIPKAPQTRLLVAEVQSYASVAERGDIFRSSKYRKELVEGLTISEFLLPPADDVLEDWCVVNFRELYTADRDRLTRGESFIGLDSPYREHLGQAFARYMMRVGLPTGLDEFKSYKLPKP